MGSYLHSATAQPFGHEFRFRNLPPPRIATTSLPTLVSTVGIVQGFRPEADDCCLFLFVRPCVRFHVVPESVPTGGFSPRRRFVRPSELSLTSIDTWLLFPAYGALAVPFGFRGARLCLPCTFVGPVLSRLGRSTPVLVRGVDGLVVRGSVSLDGRALRHVLWSVEVVLCRGFPRLGCIFVRSWCTSPNSTIQTGRPRPNAKGGCYLGKRKPPKQWCPVGGGIETKHCPPR